MNKLTLFLSVCALSLFLSIVSVITLFIYFSNENTAIAAPETTNSANPATQSSIKEIHTPSPRSSSTADVEASISPDPKFVTSTPAPTASPTPLHFPKEKKLVALSFDDGPSKYTTSAILDILKKRNIKATFCVLGIQVEDYPEILKREVKEGHEIVNHTYLHKNWFKLSIPSIKEEIDKTKKIIKKVSNYDCTVVRPPYGNYRKSMMTSIPYNLYLWSVDPMDWKFKNSKKIINSVLKNVTDGSVVLLHDVYPTTEYALEPIIDALEERGYQFVTVNDLYRSRRIINGVIVPHD